MRRLRGIHKTIWVLYEIEGIINLCIFASAMLLSFVAIGIILVIFFSRIS